MARERESMEADGAQTPKRRRKAKSMDVGSPEPQPQVYSNKERTGRITSSPQTEGFRVDEGYTDPPRTKSSTVRMGPTGSMPQVTQTIPTTSIPNRRQQAATRQLSPRPTRKISLPPEIKPTKPSLFAQLKQMHWLFLVGLGMMSTLLLWLIGSSVLTWGTQRYNDFRYGNPRTSQTDMAVGHGGDNPTHPSHFIAMNLHNQVVVIELKAGKADKDSVAWYVAPISTLDSGQAPVTVGFKDLNSDQKLDMIIDVHLSGQDQLYFFINEGDKFRPANENEVDKFRQ